MGDPDTAAKPVIDIPGYGKFSPAPPAWDGPAAQRRSRRVLVDLPGRHLGANNDKARDYIAKKLGPSKAILVKGGGMDVHMSTNAVAVKMLP